jgi:hypothetical protein
MQPRWVAWATLATAIVAAVIGLILAARFDWPRAPS